jgi:hypothetical protein
VMSTLRTVMAGELLQYDVSGFLVPPPPITFHLFELQCVHHNIFS